MGKAMVTIIYNFLIKKDGLNSSYAIRGKFARVLKESYMGLKEGCNKVGSNGRFDLIEHSKDILNTICLYNPSSLLYLGWVIAQRITSLLRYEYGKFNVVGAE